MQFSREEEEKIKTALGTFCSNQPSALELIKRRRKKDQKFGLFMQVESLLPSFIPSFFLTFYLKKIFIFIFLLQLSALYWLFGHFL